ncbi:putative OB-fold protein [Tamaricihabitans halophyticus]|uniref:Putative OB-fold protein n=1 Tax=Tamaricihabitans halophyticus TaxID=1262583 RepID=A0A4R2QVN8_9PSEU|nr:OB-fold domain-containing protein [Tamaricihabitans halophyticus]TCP54140.1 putative OB-fold protein [Tamaricihabitans halophyticus]
MTILPQRPIEPGLFTWPADQPQLIGSRCAGCAEIVFPARTTCPRCMGMDVEQHLLATRGTLWTWTIQGFRPKPPFGLPEQQHFEPFGVGYIELAGQTRVEARLTESDSARLAIGMPMELTTVPLWRDGDHELITYAFQPIYEGDDSHAAQ